MSWNYHIINNMGSSSSSLDKHWTPTLDPIALATITGTIIAWIMLIASFTDATYSMLRRLDEAMQMASTGSANIPIDELILKSTIAKYFMLVYLAFGAVIAPGMVLASILFFRSSKCDAKDYLSFE